MQTLEMLRELESIARKLGLEVRLEEGAFGGGFCRVGKKRFFLLNRADPLERRIEILKQGLSRLDLSALYIRPALRRELERSAWAAQAPDRADPPTLPESGAGLSPPRLDQTRR